ncbi:MAG: hypothetical protein GY725_27125 [bacterium]|nr:hypothetical protein [bacterium]
MVAPIEFAAVQWSAGLVGDQAPAVLRLCAKLTDAQLAAMVDSYSAFLRVDAERKESAFVEQSLTPLKLTAGVRSRVPQPMQQRLSQARAYRQWCYDEGQDPFHLSYGRFGDWALAARVSDKDKERLRQSLYRSLQLLQDVESGIGGGPCKRAVRALGMQGRPSKAPLVRQLLFEFFCSIRRSVSSRIPSALMQVKASALVEDYILDCFQHNLQPDPPTINRNWMSRWRNEYRVSFRQPNRKSKVPKSVLTERLRITWSNLIRVRALARAVLGYDLSLHNADQSPFHKNEAGSKNMGTLTFKGAPTVPIKEDHAGTRSRWSVQTLVSSSYAPALAGAAGQEAVEPGASPPGLELMFKADGERLAASLQLVIPAWAPWLTVVTSLKGSYREEHVLSWMERHLPALAGSRRWRILVFDAFAPQMTEAVRRLAWERGYVLVLHGGGATSVCQPNDTDLHQPLRRGYVGFESADALLQQRLHPLRCPFARNEDCLAWMALCWNARHLHESAATGFWKNGLANALDGSQDHLAVREAKGFWDSLGMSSVRDRLVVDIETEAAAGRLSWTYEQVSALVEVGFFPNELISGFESPLQRCSAVVLPRRIFGFTYCSIN